MERRLPSTLKPRLRRFLTAYPAAELAVCSMICDCFDVRPSQYASWIDDGGADAGLELEVVSAGASTTREEAGKAEERFTRFVARQLARQIFAEMSGKTV